MKIICYDEMKDRFNQPWSGKLFDLENKEEFQILEKRSAAPDHPVLINFPESNYLQCWILRVL